MLNYLVSMNTDQSSFLRDSCVIHQKILQSEEEGIFLAIADHDQEMLAAEL